MKNIVVCCDGTSNEFSRDRTNVVKLFYALEPSSPQQVTYYHPGLGTMEPPGIFTDIGRAVTKLLGLAFGYGLPADIRDAYVFLMNNYEPGDRVFLFGFSRGAYTVRALAGLVQMYGLIPRGNEPLVPYAIRMLMAVNNVHEDEHNPKSSATAQSVFGLARAFKDTFSSRPCDIWFAGVWDTVSSVGWISHPLKVPFSANNPSIHIGRHAVSIDERRAFFRTNLWEPKPPPAPSGPVDMKQVWFPGAHCDVGSGYPSSESWHSNVALDWMIQEAKANGLFIDAQRSAAVIAESSPDLAAASAQAPLHESLRGWWRLAEFLPKRHFDYATKTWGWRFNLFRRRFIPAGVQVHESAFKRGAAYMKRLPPDAVPVQTIR